LSAVEHLTMLSVKGGKYMVVMVSALSIMPPGLIVIQGSTASTKAQMKLIGCLRWT